MQSKKLFFHKFIGIIKRKRYYSKKLAQLLNIKESVISLWVTGKTKPSSKSLLKLAEIFDIPVGNFFDKKQNFTIDKKTSEDSINLLLKLIDENNKRFERENALLRKETEFLNKRIDDLEKALKKLKK